LHEGDAVEVMIMTKTDLGYSVIVNQKHKGLLFEGDIFFKTVNSGDVVTGYVKHTRNDNKPDIHASADWL